jgi:MFS family permease
VGDLGLLALAGFIGAVIAFFIGGKLIDIISAYMTKKNGGTREPEFRLPAIIIPTLIGPMGVLTFGLSAARHLPWIAAAFGYAMQGFGLTALSNVAVTYAVDSYREVSFLDILFRIRNVALVSLFFCSVSLHCSPLFPLALYSSSRILPWVKAIPNLIEGLTWSLSPVGCWRGTRYCLCHPEYYRNAAGTIYCQLAGSNGR